MIRGTKVCLRAPDMADLEARFRWVNDPEVTRYLRIGQAIPQSREQVRAFWESVCRGRPDHVELCIESLDGALIGAVALRDIDMQNATAELSILIGEKAYWNQGCGTEATRLMVALGFRRQNLHRIWLRVDEEHAAAIRAYEKVGFRREGLFREDTFRHGRYRNTVLMGILSAEFDGTGLPDL